MSTNGKWLRTSLFWLLILLVIILIAVFIFRPPNNIKQVNVSTILHSIQLDKGKQQDTLSVSSDTLTLTRGTGPDATKEAATIPSSFDAIQALKDSSIDYTSSNGLILQYQQPGPFVGILGVVGGLIPFILFGAFLIFIVRQAQGSNNQAMSFGKSRARMFMGNKPAVTFSDVAGVEEAKQELQEVVEFLKYPEKFRALGARIPKGVLLVGPPGTGKTLLSKAVAGEAGVPFFSISGSEFVEMFVGVGASRVRDLFDQAKKASPCIVFVDEIDAVGRQRGTGLGGGNDEREQTLNQLLVEMDGFDTDTAVIVIAATNRPDVLDPALLRPGRFDRHVTLDRPDVRGRRAILDVHVKDQSLAPEANLDVLARQTPGFCGADLANLVNEAAILAARSNRKAIGMDDLEEAIYRVIAGPERKSMRISDEEKRVVAYHEAGHALVMHALPQSDRAHRISIISRGSALGWTLSLPGDDQHLANELALHEQLAGMMGGRVAEEIVFGNVTSGAENDIKRVTQLARRMVTQWGMSERIGPVAMGENNEVVFLGRDLGERRRYSDERAALIDMEVRRIVEEARGVARNVLTERRAFLTQLAERLISEETVE